LRDSEADFHSECALRIFGVAKAPQLDYSMDEMDALASRIIQAQTTLTGVQPKLSLHINKHNNANKLTIVGLWGDFIFKPQSERFAQLPENEDLSMHLAQIAKIKVVPHSLVRMRDGNIGYITRRIDRIGNGEKLAMEDMCQLTERITEHKYKSSYEQIAKAIRKYSSSPQIDVTDFLEVVYFSWLIGNNDMHLKNFSLYQPGRDIRLTPAYDMLNVAIANPGDDEELALSLNGKRKKITDGDFVKAFETCGVPVKVFEGLKKKYRKLVPVFFKVIDSSFLDDNLKEGYKNTIDERLRD